MISDFRVSNFFKHFPAAGYIDTMLFVFVWFKISFYFKTLRTKCTRWFDLSSFGSVNTLVAIGNERERFRWNQQHTLELTAEETRALMCSLIMRFKREKSTCHTLLKEQNFRRINPNEPEIHVQLENRTT